MDSTRKETIKVRIGKNRSVCVCMYDRRLFKSIIQCQTHVLRHLFIDKPTSTRSFRCRAHNFILPPKDNRHFVSIGFFTRLSAPLRTARSSLCLFAEAVLTTDYILLILFMEFFSYAVCKPLFVCVKGGLNKRRLDLTAYVKQISTITQKFIHCCTHEL